MNSVIRTVKVFESLSDEDCAELLRFMRIRQYEAGALVFERGKPGDTMLVVADGALSVVMPAPRSATILAAVRTTAYELGRQELTRMRHRAPRVATALVGAVVRSVILRLRRVDERIERELAGHLAARLPELRQTAGKSARNLSFRTPSPPGAATGSTGPSAWTALLGRLRGSA